MTFTLNEQYDTLATVWIKDDPDDHIMRVGEILQTLFGAYLSGPMSNYANPAYQSFGFWNQALLSHARRVFPLPDGLQPGRPIYLSPLTEEQWQSAERSYNKKPEDFFHA
jgi:hypothetical protein